MAALFDVPGELSVGSPTRDGGMRLRFRTKELTAEEKLALIQCDGAYGHILFKENEFDGRDIPNKDAADERKTPSQRLRGILYRVYESGGDKGKDFNAYYRAEMDKICEHYKNKI